jgi:hypothetical protein
MGEAANETRTEKKRGQSISKGNGRIGRTIEHPRILVPLRSDVHRMDVDPRQRSIV